MSAGRAPQLALQLISVGTIAFLRDGLQDRRHLFSLTRRDRLIDTKRVSPAGRMVTER
jgi:hypothetical protein